MDPSMGDWIIRFLGAFGGIGGISFIVGVILYGRQEKIKRDLANESEDQTIADKVNAMLERTTKSLDERYEQMRKLYDEQTRNLNEQITINSKLQGKITRIIQVMKQGVEYRAGLAVANPDMHDVLGYDKAQLMKIEEIVIENGQVTRPLPGAG
jgi:hypothetical protein